MFQKKIFLYLGILGKRKIPSVAQNSQATNKILPKQQLATWVVVARFEP